MKKFIIAGVITTTVAIMATVIFLKANPKTTVTDSAPVITKYTTYGRYYTDGTLITTDGHIWSYATDVISDEKPYDGIPVWCAFSDSGTPNDITDDAILGLVYDRETAIYDALENTLSEEFEITRDGNIITIKIKED